VVIGTEDGKIIDLLDR